MRRYLSLLVALFVSAGCARVEAEPEKERPKEESPFMGVFYQRAPVRSADAGDDVGTQDLQPFTP